MPQAALIAPAIRRDELPLAGRSMEVRHFKRAAPDADSKTPLATARLVLSTGAPVRRYDWFRERYYDEQLVVAEGAVRLGRVARGAPLLNTHSAWDLEDVLGVLLEPEIIEGRVECNATFSRRDSVAGYVQDVADEIIRNVSVGYARKRVEMVAPAEEGGVWTYRVVDWEIYEGSLVPIPADMDSQVVRSAGNAHSADAHDQTKRLRTFECEFIEIRSTPAVGNPATTQKGSAMTEEELRAQREREAAAESQRLAAEEANRRAATQAASNTADTLTRAADITDLCVRHGVPKLAAELIRTGKTLADAQSAVLNARAAADEAGGQQRNVRIETVGDEAEVRLAGMEEAIHSRVDPKVKVTDNGRQYRGLSLLEMGREILEARGINTRGLTRMDLASKMLTVRSPGMHTTSDFASIFSNVASKRLRQAYTQQPSSYQMWARRAPSLPDFKTVTIAALSGAPELLQVNEHGEFKYGTLTDGAETYRLLTYGRIVAMTRQAIINDDLRAFDRLVSAFGDSANRLENRLVYSELTTNAAMADGVALFHATHGNLGSGAISVASLAAGRAAMRIQKGMSSEQLNTIPKYLIVPAALEGIAYQYTSANYTPTAQTGINEFAAGGRTALTVIVEPLLDAVSTAVWYLATDNGSVDTVEYAFLEGEEGPVIETEVGFEVDGTSWKCREDFAAKATDYRGLYKSTGV